MSQVESTPPRIAPSTVPYLLAAAALVLILSLIG
jgi:hypothetical protein